MPVPSWVLVGRAMVGSGRLDHTIPLAVIGEPLSKLMTPPLMALKARIAVTEVVINSGGLFM